MNDLQKYAPQAARDRTIKLVDAALAAGFSISVNDDPFGQGERTASAQDRSA